MTTVTFDTLASSRRMRERGIPQEHAEAFADEMRIANQIGLDHLSTKEELSVLKSEMKSDFALMRSEMKGMETRLKLHAGTMIVALGGILIAVRYFG